MAGFVRKFLHSTPALVLSIVFGLAIGAAGLVAVLQPPAAMSDVAAASCDNVNIIHCGLAGSSDAGYIKSFKQYYNKGSDGRYNDLKHVFRWAGASDVMVRGMNTANTKLGTMNANGDIYVGGKKVGHDAKMAARFREANWTGVVHVGGNVYARTVTPSSTEHNSYRVLVHFNGSGVADFAVATSCGNAIKFVPVQPKPVLACTGLTYSLLNRSTNEYQFKASASAKHTTITSYVFHFGDGTSKKVSTHGSHATVQHRYAKDNHRYTAYAVVNSTRKSGVTDAHCRVSFTTPKPQPSLNCVSLTQSIVADKTNTYQLNATAHASNTTITSYVFDFGDGQQQTVTTGKTNASLTHTYSQADTSYTATVHINSQAIKNVGSANCQVVIKTPPTPTTPQLLCQNLSFNAVSDRDNTYRFTATASASNTTITSYVFSLDGKNQRTINSSDTTASTTYTLPDTTANHTVSVAVNSTDLQNVTSAHCRVTLPGQPQQPECKPGVPTGSSECNECKPGVPAGSAECQPATPPSPQPPLPNTGAGDVIGFFGATTLAGGLIHRFILRRKLA